MILAITRDIGPRSSDPLCDKARLQSGFSTRFHGAPLVRTSPPSLVFLSTVLTLYSSHKWWLLEPMAGLDSPVCSCSEKGHARPSWASPHTDRLCSFTDLGNAQPVFSRDACQGILALLDVSFLVCGKMQAAGWKLCLEVRLRGFES